MPSRTVTIASRSGLHARPAALFARHAGRSGLDVRIGRPSSPPVSAGSILAVLGLGLGLGEEVLLSAEGANAEAVLNELVELLEVDLDAQ